MSFFRSNQSKQTSAQSSKRFLDYDQFQGKMPQHVRRIFTK